MIKVTNIAETEPFNISTRLLMQVALERKYELYYYPAAPGRGTGITRAVKHGRELFFQSTTTALTPAFGYFSAQDKLLSHSLLSDYGINVPDTASVAFGANFSAAEHMLAAHKKVVVKPSAANHGDGVTVNVTSQPDLERAISFAQDTGVGKSDVIVQQQVAGREYRFLVVAGKTIAVAHRRPPFVVGDGRSTILELIEQKNSDPRRGKGHTGVLTAISVNDVRYHKGEDFLGNVPQAGEEVEVLDTSNLSRGGESVDFTDEASPALKRMAEAAAAATFLGIAGVDIMTKDITADTTDHSYVIEVNMTPGIRMHQFPSIGQPRNVALKIFLALEKTAHPVGSKPLRHIGRVENVSFPTLDVKKLPARIDTGATVSSLWASQVKETARGLSFVLFDESSLFYTGQEFVIPEYGKRTVSSSMGQVQIRYQVKIPLSIARTRILTTFTLADRSTQMYPVLIGRNVLKGKFIVDVASGNPDRQLERSKRAELDKLSEL